MMFDKSKWKTTVEKHGIPMTAKACSELKMPLLFSVTVSMESQSYLRM